MKTSATNIAWEEKSEDISAQILAQRVRKEARLREIVEQSAASFFIGGSALANIFRIVGLIAIGTLYFRSAGLSASSVWPVFALGAFVEACRANRRLDALLELERIAKARCHPAAPP